MKQIAQAILAIGFVALGFWGYQADISHAGWLVGIGVFVALNLL
jgi:hypothetical protein